MSHHYCVVVRFWPGWHYDCGFPLEKFNGLDDDIIGNAVRIYKCHWAAINYGKIEEALRRRKAQCTWPPNKGVSWLDQYSYEMWLERQSGNDLVAHAELLRVPVPEPCNRKELLKNLHVAGINAVRSGAFEFARSGKGALAGIVTATPKDEKPKAPRRPCIEKIAGWAQFPGLVYENSPASRRQPVWLAETREVAGRIAEGLHEYFRDENSHPVFSVLPATDFYPTSAARDAFNLKIRQAIEGVQMGGLDGGMRTIVKIAKEFAAVVTEEDEQVGSDDEDSRVTSKHEEGQHPDTVSNHEAARIYAEQIGTKPNRSYIRLLIKNKRLAVEWDGRPTRAAVIQVARERNKTRSKGAMAAPPAGETSCEGTCPKCGKPIPGHYNHFPKGLCKSCFDESLDLSTEPDTPGYG